MRLPSPANLLSQLGYRITGNIALLDAKARANCAFMRGQHAVGKIPDYEAVLEQGYRCFLRPGMVIADVGAHLGRHLQHFVSLVGSSGRVSAFEPLPACFAALQAMHLGSNVSLYNVALSNRSGRAEFIFAQGTPQESGLRQREYNQPDIADPVKIEVETQRLDDIADRLDRLDFLKIDAEGAELLILEGAEQTLRRLRPVVSVEYGRPSYSAYGNTNMSLFDFAQRHGFVICDLFGASIAARGSWVAVCDQAYWDWYLVPQERAAAWRRSMAPMHAVQRVVSAL